MADLLSATTRWSAELARFDGEEIDTAATASSRSSTGRRARSGAGWPSATRWADWLEVRAGVHTGEVERRPATTSGIAVHIGARVMSLAGAGEVLVSSTTHDLVAGSGLEFEDRGEHVLKGSRPPAGVRGRRLGARRQRDHVREVDELDGSTEGRDALVVVRDLRAGAPQLLSRREELLDALGRSG